ncbi:MAG: disulfide bond formation protein B [Candidatus Altimarinota bacterium]
MNKKARIVSYLIFLQALLAMLGSLYFSNFGDPIENFKLGVFWLPGYGFDPCQLCWWARILMYPIVPISLVGILRKDPKFTSYILPLAIPGIFLEVFHYTLQKTNIDNPFACTGANPCSALYVDYLGFMTIPFLCLTAFTVIVGLSFYHRRLMRSSV